MKKTLLALTMASTLGLAGTAAVADDYVIDTEGAHAFINFKISHLGYSWLTGRFNDFEGSFTYDADDVAASSIEVTIDTSSIDSNHAERDRHLRSDDFLDVSEYPQAKFVSTGVTNVADDGESFHLVGDLTLHGQTNEVTIDVKKVGAGEDPWGGYRVGFAGSTEFELKDFGIDYDLGPEARTIYMDLHVEGIKQ